MKDKIKKIGSVVCACLIGLLSVLSVAFLSPKDNHLVSAKAEEVETISEELDDDDYFYYFVLPVGLEFVTSEKMDSCSAGFIQIFDSDYTDGFFESVLLSYYFLYGINDDNIDYYDFNLSTEDGFNFVLNNTVSIPLQYVHFGWLNDFISFGSDGYFSISRNAGYYGFQSIDNVLFSIKSDCVVFLRRVPKEGILNDSGEVDGVGFLNELSADMYWFKARLNDGATDFSDFTLLDSAFAVSCNVEFDFNADGYKISDAPIPEYLMYPFYHVTTDYTNVIQNPYTSLSNGEFVGMYMQVNFNPLLYSDTRVSFYGFGGLAREVIYQRKDTGGLLVGRSDILSSVPDNGVSYGWGYKYFEYHPLYKLNSYIKSVRIFDLTYGSLSYELDDMIFSNNKLIDYSYDFYISVFEASDNLNQEEAYNRGYNKGAEDASTYTFMNLITSVIDAPVKVFLNIVDFEILGADMKPFVLSILTAALVIALYRFFSGG